MKKSIILIFIVLLLVVSIKYFSSNYEINYKLKGYNIQTIYKNKRYYIEIDNKYNFDIYKQRGISKLKIEDIKTIENNNLKCIYPIIKKVKTYPLCYLDEEFVDYNIINEDILLDYKNSFDNSSEGNFYFNKNLAQNEYILLWNYKGFYKMNGNELETIDLFNEGKYDNSLMYQIDNKILFPNYNEEYVFNKFYLLNMLKGKNSIINSDYEISYNSYIVGNIKNKIYLFDLKESKLYEIDIKKMIVKLVGSEELGYYKYENNKKVKANASEYKNKELTYIKDDYSNYKYEINDNKLYKSYNESDLKIKIFEGKSIKIIAIHNNVLYFVSEDVLYRYDSINLYKIFNYFELNFNENNIIYIYQ